MALDDHKWHVLALNLALGVSVKDAADRAGVSERTAHRVSKKPAFVRRLRRIQGDMRERIVGRLTDACTDAVQTLRDLLGAESPATARLGAARAILEHAGRLAEMVQLESRIAALETTKDDQHAEEFAKPY